MRCIASHRADSEIMSAWENDLSEIRALMGEKEYDQEAVKRKLEWLKQQIVKCGDSTAIVRRRARQYLAEIEKLITKCTPSAVLLGAQPNKEDASNSA